MLIKFIIKLIIISTFIIFLRVNPVISQEVNVDSTLLKDDLEFLDQLTEFDSLNIIYLIDSLLSLELDGSQFSARFGYISKVLSAGRNFGEDQWGFSPGISYYHKSGLYADLSGYWNSEFEPKYYLTILSGGYMHSLTQMWSFILSYDRYFYSPSGFQIDNSLNNSINASTYLNFGNIDTGIDYGFFFGDESAHKLQWNLSGRIIKEEFWITDKITIIPSFSVQFGNQTITSIRFRRDFLNRISLRYFIEEKKVFGLMNYDLSLPIIIKINKFGLLVSYHYTVPVELPGEDVDLSPNSSIRLNLMYTFSL